MKKRKISVSFATNYEDVYLFLMKKPNISQFVCEVVREKMMQEEENCLEQQIEKIVEKLIMEKGITLNTSDIQLSNGSPLQNEDKDLIDSLF